MQGLGFADTLTGLSLSRVERTVSQLSAGLMVESSGLWGLLQGVYPELLALNPKPFEKKDPLTCTGPTSLA